MTSRFPTTEMSKDRIRLDALDQSKSLDQEDYKKLLKRFQFEVLNHQLLLREKKRAVIIVMEGPDAAGKGGAIKRLVERLDPRLIRVYSTVKPTPEEYGHHYLRRFWTRLPSYGQAAIFDRSWYGRVLVERVERFCADAEWKRAFREINEFERLLLDDGAIISKMYLHITKEEQLDRFKRREADPYKHWKISDEDWRNRRHWDQHNEAAEEMFERTSTPDAPWTVIPANFKWFARVKVVQAVAEHLARVLGS